MVLGKNSIKDHRIQNLIIFSDFVSVIFKVLLGRTLEKQDT